MKVALLFSIIAMCSTFGSAKEISWTPITKHIFFDKDTFTPNSIKIKILGQRWEDYSKNGDPAHKNGDSAPYARMEFPSLVENYEYSCQSFTIAETDLTYFDRNGHVMSAFPRSNSPAGLREPMPKSIEEYILKYACNATDQHT